jgi:5-methylcytosine-specific restriction endonuclease McrA
VPLRPEEPSNATLEHIVPKHHGGTDAPENLAVACARCNQGKGKRLDKRRADDPTLVKVIATLQERRKQRLR